jgi:4-amino-4-deoxy-L-arabinose transferase-like glycosyltransferase
MAIVLPALAGGLWLITERRLGDVRRLMLLPGALIVLAIVVPWYGAVYQAHGWEYITQFFVGENLGRFASPITTARSSLFFVPVLFADILLPWAPLLAVPLLTAWRRDGTADADGAIRRLLWWWIVAIVAAFSVSASKEDLYILPVVPAAAALIADALMRSAWGEAHRGVGWVLAAIAILCAGMAWLVVEFFGAGYYAIAGAPAIAALLATTGVLTIVALWRRHFEMAVLTLAAGFVAFNYLFVARVLPDLERMKPVPPLAAIVNARAGAGAALAFFNMDLPSFVYYTRRPVTKVGDADQAARFFDAHADAWMLSGAAEFEALQARMPDLCVAARRPLFVAKASDILRRQPPPDVLLVTRAPNCRPTGEKPAPSVSALTARLRAFVHSP